jgi:signal transduction histidine kinase
MSALSLFFERNMVTVFFFYGLAFFSMGLAVWLESGRTSETRIARSMLALAGFGVLHGAHEWVEMFGRLGEFPANPNPTTLVWDGARVVVLAASFLLLVLFGARLIFSPLVDASRARRMTALVVGGLLAVWVLSVSLTAWLYQPEPAVMVTAADVLARYILATPGALVAAWGMVLEQRTLRARGAPELGQDLLWAALALFLYGAVGQTFPRPSLLFPSTIVNSALFSQWFGIPIQLFRAVNAGVIALFVIRTLRTFEVERQHHLAAANEARQTAQREALEVQQQARIQTEQLNRQLQMAVQDLFMLFEVSRSLVTTLDVNVLLHQAVAMIVSSVPRIDFGLIVLRDRAEGPAEAYYSADELEPSRLEPAREVARRVIETGDLVGVIDFGTMTQSDAEPSVSGDEGRTVCVPLRIKGRVAGSLLLRAKASAPVLGIRDLSLIQTAAGQLSMAIENATLYREVQAREELRGQMLRQIVSAQEKERQRIARELHDGTGQVLTALGLGLAAASESVKSDPGMAGRQLVNLKILSNQALQEVHNVIADLRPSVLYDLGLTPALRGQLQDFESQTRVRAQLVLSGERRRLPLETETVVFRIVQEALTNVARHAAANCVVVNLDFGTDFVMLEIQDDGRGFNPDETLDPGVRRHRGWGLLGMKERVALVGGECQIDSQPGSGTTIRVRIQVGGKEGENVKDQTSSGG